MARGVKSFFDGFNQGYETVGGLIRDFQSDKIARENPEDVTTYTPDQVKSMESIANTVDEQGNKVYEFVPQEGTANYGLRVRQPDGSYQPVEGAGMAPTARTRFLGKDYDPAELTPQKIDRLRYGALADVEARFDPAKSLRMRREVGQMEREDEQYARTKTISEREDAAYARQEERRAGIQQFMNNRLTQPDGTMRAPTPEDFTAAQQFQTVQLFKSGDVEQAAALMEKTMAYMNNQIQYQSNERKAALGPASAAAANGDFGPLMQFYNKFVPDGAKVTDIKMGPKGEIVVYREGADGQPLATQTIKGGMEELLAGARELVDPGALAKYSMDSFTRQMAIRKANNDDAQVGIARQRLKIEEGKADREKRDPKMVMDDKGQIAILDQNNLKYDDNGIAKLPPGYKPLPTQASPLQRIQARKLLVDSGKYSDPQIEIMLDEQFGPAGGVAAPGQGGADADLVATNKQRGGGQGGTPGGITRVTPGDVSPQRAAQVRQQIAALDQQIAQAEAQAQAAARSGDRNSIVQYGDRVNSLRAQRSALTEGWTQPAMGMLR